MKKVVCNLKKIFIVVSCMFLFTLIIIYSYRLVHFYRLENSESEGVKNNNYFSDKLKKTINVQDANGGLYIIGDEYLYKYNVTDNYLWYSGQLWRILKINEDDTIDIVMSDSLSILNAKYLDKNYINEYINDFYNKLDKEFLIELEYCNDSFNEVDNITCEDKIKGNITLLDIYTYTESGGNSSFLNNNSSYWLINENDNKNNWYINNNGSLSIGEDINSFGVRPVVRLKSDIELLNGDGTINNPYIIKNKENINIGEYVKFNDTLWRIIDLNNGITISSVDCLKLNNECVLQNFGNTNIYEKSELYNYLNTTYYKTIKDKEFILKHTFEIGNYINYNYKNTSLKTVDAFIGISKVSDYYITNKTNSYLLTTNDLQAIYSINDNSNYYLTFPNEQKKIYPVITLDSNLKIEGNGTINSPYKLSR